MEVIAIKVVGNRSRIEDDILITPSGPIICRSTKENGKILKH
jgi:hypothetical protein